MKVILCKDVAKIGKRNDVVVVPDGYALNKLIPQKMAEPATPKNIERVRSQKVHLDEVVLATKELYTEIVTKVKDVTISFDAKANESGGLFQSVKVSEVAEAISSSIGVAIPESFVEIQESIKHTGEHTVYIVFQDLKSPCTLSVQAIS